MQTKQISLHMIRQCSISITIPIIVVVVVVGKSLFGSRLFFSINLALWFYHLVDIFPVKTKKEWASFLLVVVVFSQYLVSNYKIFFVCRFSYFHIFFSPLFSLTDPVWFWHFSCDVMCLLYVCICVCVCVSSDLQSSFFFNEILTN